MNPLLRWVTKIIRFFRPTPAPVAAQEAPTFRASEPAPVEAKVDVPAQVEHSEVHQPEPVQKSMNPAVTEIKTEILTPQPTAKEEKPQVVENLPEPPKIEEPLPTEKPIEQPAPQPHEVEISAKKSGEEILPVAPAAVPHPELVKESVQPALPKGGVDALVALEESKPAKKSPPEPSTLGAEPLPPKRSEPIVRQAQDDKPLTTKVVEKMTTPASPSRPQAEPAPVPEPKPVVEPETKPEPKPIFTGRVELTPDLDNPARLRQIKGVISVNDIANRELLDLVPYEPGKPVDDVAREIGLDPASIIKLASNENPLGPSPLAMAAMHKAIESSHFYPDGGGFHLRNAIAHAFGLGRENVVLGNGSNEIIELLFHTFTRPGIHEIITARHAFAVYTLMAQLFGVHAIVVDDVDFTPDLPAMLKAVTPQTRLIFLASPNNPTGTRVTNEALDAFIRDLPPHVIAVLDEAYYEFLDNPPDTVGYVKNGARVVLMRTFSKIQGLAGLRVGYGLAAAEIANLLQRARQPFNANLIAQAGAMAGLADIEHQKKTKAITDEGRNVIEAAFAKMELKYVPSAANFVMVHVGDGGEVFKRLMKKGIIVRSMVSYHLPEYIRVSIGTPEQNARFLAELPGALEGLVSFTRP
jgi:histidinol-phosphate aminotransferase